MKLDKDFAKKQFWFLLAGAAPLALIALLFLLFVVPGTTEGKRKKVEEQANAIRNFKDLFNQKFVDQAKAKADVRRSQEVDVWKAAWNSQKSVMTWPSAVEKEFQFKDGNFALEIVVHPESTKLAEMTADDVPELDKKEEKATFLFHGTFKDVDKDWVQLQGRTTNRTEKFRRTTKVKISSSEEKEKTILFQDLKNYKDKKFAVTFQKGKFFGDDLTDSEQSAYDKYYVDQLPDILAEAVPVNIAGKPLVLFKDWTWKDKEELPPAGAKASSDGKAGGDGKFFRYVDKWDRQNLDITEEAWIAQEDLWVQRELYRLVKKANDYVAEFAGQGGANVGKPFVFKNHYWQLEMTLKSGQELHVKISNLLSRRQAINVPLLVKIEPDQKGKEGAVELLERFDGPPLAPKGTVDDKGKPLDTFEQTFTLKGGAGAKGIYGVKQVLTWDTAAVRRIDLVSMGSKIESQSHRTAARTLVPHKVIPPDPKAVEGVKPRGEGPGKDLTPNKLIRDRYLEVTPQYRRLPVSVVLIVDQDHVAKVQTAFADSQLRFLTTQVLLNRFPVTVRPPEPLVAAENPNPKLIQPPIRPQAPSPASSGGDELESNIEMVIYGVVSLYERFPAKTAATKSD